MTEEWTGHLELLDRKQRESRVLGKRKEAGVVGDKVCELECWLE